MSYDDFISNKLKSALGQMSQANAKMVDSEHLRRCQQEGIIPVGFIDRNAKVDKWENKVSVLHMCDGRTYNIVHHSNKPYQHTKRSTLYGGRGKFLRITEFYSENPCAVVWIDVGGYRVEWGDGENIGVTCKNPSGIDLSGSLREIQNEDFEVVIVTVVAALQYQDNAWTYKGTD